MLTRKTVGNCRNRRKTTQLVMKIDETVSDFYGSANRNNRSGAVSERNVDAYRAHLPLASIRRATPDRDGSVVKSLAPLFSFFIAVFSQA